jgi:hypothetical protein
MQFVRVTDDHYEVTDQARCFLQSLPSTPLAVVAVVGKYRSGKSYLLNHMVAGAPFATSASVNAQTRGLWLCPDLVQGENGQQVLVVDSEGLGSVDAKAQHDVNIFSLVILMASDIIYNSTGAMTSSSVQDLQVAGKVAALLRTHASFASSLPRLLWVLRDFGLQMVDRDNQPLTPTAYIDYSLQQLDAKLTQSINQLFPQRRGIALPRPTSSDDDLATMTNLVPAFEAGMEQVSAYVQRAVAKSVGDQPITGHLLLAMMDAFCNTLNQKVAPQLVTAYEAMVQVQWMQIREEQMQLVRTVLHDKAAAAEGPSLWVHPWVRDLAWMSWQSLLDRSMEPPSMDQFSKWREDVSALIHDADKAHVDDYHRRLTAVASDLDGDLNTQLTELVHQHNIPIEFDMFGQVLLTKGGMVTAQQREALVVAHQEHADLERQLAEARQLLLTSTGELKASPNQASEWRQDQLNSAASLQTAQDECKMAQLDLAEAQAALDTAVRQSLDFQQNQQRDEFDLRETREENAELKQSLLTIQKHRAALTYQLSETTRHLEQHQEQLSQQTSTQTELAATKKQLDQAQCQNEEHKHSTRELETKLRIAQARETQLEEQVRKRPRLSGPDLAMKHENNWLRERQSNDRNTINDQKSEIRQLRMEQRRRDADHASATLGQFRPMATLSQLRPTVGTPLAKPLAVVPS